MAINVVDILTIIMGKTIEYFTKALPNIKHHNEPITLAEALNDLKEFANYVTDSSKYKQTLLPKSHARKVEQLTLFIKESKAIYETRNHK